MKRSAHILPIRYVDRKDKLYVPLKKQKSGTAGANSSGGGSSSKYELALDDGKLDCDALSGIISSSFNSS